MKIIRVVIFSLSVFFFFFNIQLSLYRMEFIIYLLYFWKIYEGKFHG